MFEIVCSGHNYRQIRPKQSKDVREDVELTEKYRAENEGIIGYLRVVIRIF